MAGTPHHDVAVEWGRTGGYGCLVRVPGAGGNAECPAVTPHHDVAVEGGADWGLWMSGESAGCWRKRGVPGGHSPP